MSFEWQSSWGSWGVPIGCLVIQVHLEHHSTHVKVTSKIQAMKKWASGSPCSAHLEDSYPQVAKGPSWTDTKKVRRGIPPGIKAYQGISRQQVPMLECTLQARDRKQQQSPWSWALNLDMASSNPSGISFPPLMWVKQCHKPPIWEWFIHVYTNYLWWTWGWFIVVIPTIITWLSTCFFPE